MTVGATTQRQSTAAARFYDGPPPLDFPASCQRTRFDDCESVSCPVPDGGVPLDMGAPFVGLARSAGPLTLSGGLVPVVLVADERSAYSMITQTTLLYHGGEMLTVKADGADVPPFTITTTAPSQITVTAPRIDNGAVKIDRNADLSVTWSGGGAGEVVLSLMPPLGSPTGAAGVVCRFPAMRGWGGVRQDAFAYMLTGSGAIYLRVTSSADLAAGDTAVSLEADTAALSPDGLAFGPAIWQ
jgi:hypothetical protein